MTLRRTLRMEWTKLRSVRTTAWSLVATVAATAALGAAAAGNVDASDCAPPPCLLDSAKVSLTGVYIGQLAVVALAALAVTSEYDAMMIPYHAGRPAAAVDA